MRNEIRCTRFTPDEAASVDSAARSAGMTTAGFLRLAALRLARPGAMIVSYPTETRSAHVNIIWQEPGGEPIAG